MFAEAVIIFYKELEYKGSLPDGIEKERFSGRLNHSRKSIFTFTALLKSELINASVQLLDG
jgi:hypothetical protein